MRENMSKKNEGLMMPICDPCMKKTTNNSLIKLLLSNSLSGTDLMVVARFILKFVCEICKMLDIPAIDISFQGTGFVSETAISEYSPEDNKIYINENHDGPYIDKLMAILSGLRHIWQLKTDEDFYFASYVPREKVGLEEYNLQFSEVDAIAFAFVAIEKCLNLKPLYNGMSAKMKKAVCKRAREIAGELNFTDIEV